MSDKEATIEELKTLMKEFTDERDWEKYHTPRSLAVSVSIEAAELLEQFQWNEGHEPTAKEVMEDPTKYTNVSEEIADVFLYLIEMCRVLNIDLSDAVRQKMEKNRKKYPVDLYKGEAYIEK